MLPIPMSSNPARQRQNIDVIDFELSPAEMDAFSQLQTGRLWNQDPDGFEEF